MNLALSAAVLGVGRMGRRHIQALRNLGLNLAGIADASAEALDLAGKECQIPTEKRWQDPAALLRKLRPEFVVVATTAPGHAPLACQAAEMGARFILCEKPMAISLRDCDQMIAACAEHGAKLAINHQMRSMECYQQPKRLLSSPELGGVTSIVATGGNIGLVMNGTHYFEMFHYITGEDFGEMTAWFSQDKVPNPRGPQFSDVGGMFRLTSRSGKRLLLEYGADQGHGCTVVYNARLGQIFVDELGGLLYMTAREAQYRELPTTRYGMPSVNTLRTLPAPDMIVLSQRVMAALLKGEDYCTGADGRRNVAAAVAAHLSNERGHVAVAIDDKLPVERSFPWA